MLGVKTVMGIINCYDTRSFYSGARCLGGLMLRPAPVCHMFMLCGGDSVD